MSKRSRTRSEPQCEAPTVSTKPVVSCVMPTRDRGDLARHAVEMFVRQDLRERELIVVIDGDDPVDGLESDEAARIRVVRLSGVHTIGHKLNLACELAQGRLVAHWDDDDWYAGDRLTRQVEVMTDGVDASGSGSLYFWDTVNDRWWSFRYQGTRAWVGGATLMYPRAVWQRHPFEDISVGVDFHFILGLDRIVDVARPELCVVRVHRTNTVSAIGFSPGWKSLGRTPPPEAVAVVADGAHEGQTPR